MKYNFDKIIDRRFTNSVKWSAKNPDDLEMWIADMDFEVLPEIKEAILKKAQLDSYGYCYPTEEYFDLYILWAKNQHILPLKREWLAFSTGVVASIDTILKRVTQPGQEVVMLTPIYNIFYNCIRNNGLVPVSCSFIYDSGEYFIDWKKLDALLTKRSAKVFLLCNPHNPSGTIFSHDDLVRIVEMCKKHNVLIISDEIHCDIVKPGVSYVPILSITHENVIALLSPTKAFNMAGLQTSVVAIPDEKLRNLIEKGIGQDDNGDPNTFACEATIAAFRYGADWNKQVNEYIFNNKRYMKEFFKNNIPGLRVVGGDATYLMWVDISNYSDDSDTFAKQLLDETKLHVASGLTYGIEGKTFIRINVATSLDNVKECCVRLKSFLIK